jgi:hypothetical protein
MALPVAAAAPLMALIAFTPVLESRADPWIPYARLEFLLATLAGVPLLAYGLAVCIALARRRWRTLGRLTALALVASLVAAGIWLWYDMKSMPAIEHYGWAGWYFAIVPGIFGAGTFLLLTWLIRAATSSPSHVAPGRSPIAS